MNARQSGPPGGHAGTVRRGLRRLDPRTRLLAGFLLMVQVLLIQPGWGLIVLTIVLLMFLMFARPPLVRLGLAVSALVWMLGFTVILHGFTTPGHILARIPGVDWTLTVEGIQYGGLFAGRLAALALVGVTLSLSLSALETVRALHSLGRPLEIVGVPVGSATLMLGMTLRFVPTLYAEATQLRRALIVRGWNPGKSLPGRVQAWIPLFIPLLVNALRRADDVAETLVLRGYTPGATMPSYGGQSWGVRDAALIAGVSLPGIVAATALWLVPVA